ncbi:unnamed protein product [Mytilus coruscus]|uniref:Endonuclease/exonuclease/phosphatase domain-containing protein n=1 Tax=Mytilus coruscus TaxID=42192 RepID=A0A6J8BD84_MYTCO|nr:unnamed protein product [Mytilus coruscus]
MTPNIYEQITGLDSTMDSISSVFSPLKSSSPKSGNISSHIKTRSSINQRQSHLSSNPYEIPAKTNLHIMTINCRSIKDKRQEFETALHYLKPDIVCATESWLKGVKPGSNPTKDAIMSREIFPPNYNIYRNDRGTLGGGVFVLVEKSIASVEQPSLITDGEIEWVKIKVKHNKDLLVGSFYMPHRDQKHLNELQKSLEQARANGNTNVVLAGDFNCPDIIWDTATALGPDREIQPGLVDIAKSYKLTQIHTVPTREGNLLEVVFVTNPTLVKSTNNVPGISDHDIIITDLETKVHHQKRQPRKCYIYKKAKWNHINMHRPNTHTRRGQRKTSTRVEVHQLWDTFKNQLQNTMNTKIPNKETRSRNSIQWIKHKERKMLKKKQRLYKQARKINK